jgi:hypothetical protein
MQEIIIDPCERSRVREESQPPIKFHANQRTAQVADQFQEAVEEARVQGAKRRDRSNCTRRNPASSSVMPSATSVIPKIRPEMVIEHTEKASSKVVSPLQVG